MPSDLLTNILTRIHEAAAYNSFPDWYIDQLCTHENIWGSDISVKVTDPQNPAQKIWQVFPMVRIHHRRPDNSWIFGGGWRHHPNVTLEMMKSHAIEMSFKGWIMGIPHGGAKGGIAFDPRKYSKEDTIAIVCKAVEEAIKRNCIGPRRDRWAPDVNTNEDIMKWIQDHYSHIVGLDGPVQSEACTTGKPVNAGGIPGRKQATGRGLHYALQIFRSLTDGNAEVILPEHPTVILQGFGNVGYHFAKLCDGFGLKIIGVLDQYGGVYHPNLPIADLISYVDGNPRKTVAGFHEICGGDELIDDKELFSIPADIAVPAALEEVITPEIASLLNVKVLLEAANGPTVPEADPILADRAIKVIPDIYANSAGYLVSYFEWEQDTHVRPFDILLHPPQWREEDLVFTAMHDAFNRNGKSIIRLKRNLEATTGHPIDYRLASYLYAMERVLPIYAMKRKEEL